jgi:hypothetical protein
MKGKGRSIEKSESEFDDERTEHYIYYIKTNLLGVCMKKVGVVLLVFLLLGVASAFAQYNKDQVVSVMRENRTLVGQLQSALKESRFADAEKAFYRFAELNASIQPFTPPKGDKKEWDRILGAFVSAAVRGGVASRSKDAAKADAALKELLALNKEGHKIFR